MSREQVRYFGVDGKRLIGKRNWVSDEWAVAMEMIYRYAGIVRWKSVGCLKDYTAVTRQRTRLRRRIEEEPAPSQAVKEIEVIRGHFY